MLAHRTAGVGVLLAALTVTAAAGDVRFSGRFESRLSGVRYRAGSLLSGDNTLRAALDARPGPGYAVEAAARARAALGATEFDLALMMPAAAADSLPDSLRALLRAPVPRGFELERAFASIDWSRLRVRVGKQPLAWGVGYLWNPTEVIPPKSWLDPAYERDGTNALRLELLAPVRVQAFGLPGPDLAGSSAIGRVTGTAFGFDWALTGWRRPEPDRPTDLFIGGHLQGELFLPGVWCEGGYHPAAGERPAWWELVAGADYTLPFRTWVVVEYRHYSAGTSGDPGYPVAAWLDYLRGARPGLGRDQFYVSLRQPFAGFSSLTLAGLVNPGDRSAVAMPGVQLGLADNADLNLLGMWSFGSSTSEYGAPRARGAVARLTLYF